MMANFKAVCREAGIAIHKACTTFTHGEQTVHVLIREALNCTGGVWNQAEHYHEEFYLPFCDKTLNRNGIMNNTFGTIEEAMSCVELRFMSDV